MSQENDSTLDLTQTSAFQDNENEQLNKPRPSKSTSQDPNTITIPTTDRISTKDALDESYELEDIHNTTNISQLESEPSFMVDRTYEPSEVVDTITPESVNYGNFYVFLTWGQFPIFMLST